jgi:hypothetical protein
MKCDGCTACCKAFKIKELNKVPGGICKYVTENGCSVHGTDKMPEECSLFECAYYQVNKVNENLRPDKCGIIFEKVNDTIFFGTITDTIILDKYANIQINKFLEQGFSVILKHLHLEQPYIFANNGKTEKQIWEEAREVWLLRHTTQI